MQIRGRVIGPDQPPYVIAEVSCSHAGSEAVAHSLIDVAKAAGAEAVKFQFYTPEGMAETDRIIHGSPWHGKGMWQLYAESQMPWGWGPRLKAHCRSQGLAFIASAYDLDGLNWLMQNCEPDALKVASFEATDYTLLRPCFATGLPVIVSTGMLTEAEITDINLTSADSGNHPILLRCVSAYPAPIRGATRGIPYYTKHSTNLWGFSDHTLGHAAASAAVAQNACVLEKHIQLHPLLQTADSHFSATPDEFTAYCRNVKEAWEACQPVVGDPEKDSRQFRRAPGGKRGSYA